MRASQPLKILTTHSKPFKSSKLAIPPSPFSPQYPITPLAPLPKPNHHHHNLTQVTNSTHLPPPPSNPLNWLWQCHLCHRTYQLSVTRRCLDDGHNFCSGTTVVKRGKRHPGGRKVVRHKACQSEFDYQGWKVWGEWRRRVDEERGREALLALGEVRFGVERRGKDCWNRCDYPSECSWGKQFGVTTPSPPPPPPPLVSVPSSPALAIAAPIQECVGEHSADVAEQRHSSTTTTLLAHEEETKKPSMDDLLASAKRRKRRSTGAAPSPLASNPREPATTMARQVLQKACDDLEVDFRKSLLGGLLGKGRRGSAPSSMSGEERTGASSSSGTKRPERR